MRSKLFVIFFCFVTINTNAQCPYVSGVLADALSTGTPSREGKNEFMVFNTGTSSVNVNSIKLEYSTSSGFTSIGFSVNGGTSGVWTSPTTSGLFSNTGGTITNITSGTIPANKNVIIISKENEVNYDFQTFGTDVYVLTFDPTSSGVAGYDVSGNYANTGGANRYLRISQGTSCVSTVSYMPNDLPGTDGGGAKWNAAGAITYVNTGASGAILPINLLSFSGDYLNEKPTINWTTTGNSSANYFEIEKSTDGIFYYKIGNTIARKELCIEAKKYSFIDNKNAVNTTLYRLKLIDINGEISYSQTINLSCKTNRAKTTIYPNPTSNELFIELENEAFSSLHISDFVGKIIVEQNISTAKFSINLQSIPSGIYTLELIGASGTEIHKIVKQ